MSATFEANSTRYRAGDRAAVAARAHGRGHRRGRAAHVGAPSVARVARAGSAKTRRPQANVDQQTDRNIQRVLNAGALSRATRITIARRRAGVDRRGSSVSRVRSRSELPGSAPRRRRDPSGRPQNIHVAARGVAAIRPREGRCRPSAAVDLRPSGRRQNADGMASSVVPTGAPPGDHRGLRQSRRPRQRRARGVRGAVFTSFRRIVALLRHVRGRGVPREPRESGGQGGRGAGGARVRERPARAARARGGAFFCFK